MTDRRAFTDEDLTAFLDGEADETLAREIARAQGSDPAVAARLQALTIPLGAISDAFGPALANAPAPPVLPPVETAPHRWGFRPGLAAAMATGIAAGFALALALPQLRQSPEPAGPGWLEAVAIYQSLYTQDTLAGTAPDPASLVELGSALGADLTGLANLEGLTFRRAQLLGFRDKPLIQIAYTLPDGTPVALCLLPSDNPARAAQSQALHGLAAANWTTGSLGVLLIGGQDQTVIDALAATLTDKV